MPIEVLYPSVPVCGALFILYALARTVAPPELSSTEGTQWA
jgi:hypothetical protein